MTCQEFDRHLDRLLDGASTSDDWTAAERHAAGCARCGRLLAAITGGLEERRDAERLALTTAVLARTTGSTCASAHRRLPDYVDRALPAEDRELVAGHLAGCASCRALAATLAELGALLPAFAELDPGPGFEARIAARTVHRPPEPSFPARLEAWWRRAAARPRLAFEVAYVLTLVLMVTIGNPVAAFRDTSARAASAARPHLERVVAHVIEPVATAGVSGYAHVRTTVASVAARGLSPSPHAASAGAPVWRGWFALLFGEPLDAFLRRAWETAASMRQSWHRLWSPAARDVPAARPADPRTEPGAGPAR